MATNIERFYRLTHLQEGMLFRKMLSSESSEYFIQTCMRLDGAFDLVAARASFHLLAVKHDVLRTSFFYKNATKPKQVVLKERKLEFTVEDLTGIQDDKELEERIEQIKKEDIERGFNLEKGSLLRMKIIKTAEDSYRMIWSFHHIIMDGWCLSILFGDFMNFYDQLVKGADYESMKEEVTKVRNASPRYIDYINWLDRQDEDESMNYWKNLLQDYETEAVIHPIEEGEDTDVESSEIEITLSEEKTEKVKTLSVQLGVTLSHIVEGAWGLLLQRYSNSRDVVFGKVVSGRNANVPGIESMIGLFINTIPERITSTENMTVAEYMARIRTQAVESERYEYAPLVEIQSNSAMGSKLVNTLYVFENFYMGDQTNQPNANDSSSNFSIHMEDAREQTNYDLSLSASLGKGLSLKMMYHPTAVSKHETTMLLEKLESIIEQFVENPSQAVDHIEVLTEEERDAILGAFNETSYEVPEELTMAEMFEEQALKHPEKVAVVDQGRSLTYEALNQEANQIANILASKNIGTGDYVAILAKRSASLISVILGVLKSGAAYVPIDPEYPEDRISYILEDCKASAVVTYEYQMADKKDNVFYLDLTDRTMNETKYKENPRKGKATDVAYLIYTSGTTGRPKGVMVEHTGVVSLREFFKKEYQIGENDRAIQFASMAFDAMISELCISIFSGGTMYLVPDEARRDTGVFAQFVADNDITAMILPPQFASNVNLLKPVRNIITAGSESNMALVEKLSKVSNYSNDYGPTECTVCATHWGYIPDGKERKQVPIGKPILNKKIYILHENKLCGFGMPGEICVTGAGIARGYLNQEELTEKKFVDNPFGEGRMYRTGDLGMWLPSGDIVFLGRIDEQVKIRGFRIELGEIEHVLRMQTQVQDVAVVVVTDSIGEKQIAAYVVANKAVVLDGALDAEELKQQIKKTLPDYMVPTYIKEISRIPVTVNGKLDKHALPDVNEENSKTYVAPRDEIEEKIAAIFADVLDRERVSIKDNFFHIGGHSLRATRVVNQIEAVLEKKIPLKELFDNPTVEELAVFIKNGDMQGENEIPQAVEKPRYPMSSTQRRLFLIQQMEPEQVIYNMPTNFELEGDFTKDKVAETFQKLVNRHEGLRTSFVMENGAFYQCIAKELKAEIEYEDLSDNDNWSKEEKYKQFIRPFSLETAPLMRLKMIKTGENRCLLFLDMHHIIGDAMTMNIIQEDFGALYSGKELEPLRVQYKDYTEWLTTQDLETQKEYWINQFSDEIPVLSMVTDYQRPKIQSYKGCVIDKSTGKQLREAVQDYCKKHKVTEYMVLMSGLMILLGKYSRQEDIIVGTPVAGRVHHDTEKMVGVFINTLALRGKPERNKTVSQFLDEMKTCCLNGFDNQEFAFDELVESIDLPKDISRNPLFDVMFALQNNESADVELSSTRVIGKVETEYTVAKFDLTINVNSSEAGYNFMFEYNTDLFKAETIQYMVEHYINLLHNMVADDLQQIGNIGVTDSFEQMLLLEQFNQTEHLYPEDKTVADLLKEQTEKHADKIALQFGEESMTYQVVYEQASKVASYLRAQGIQREEFVAVEAERNMETIVAICGIIMAGAAYVPLDCSYPKDRIQFIISDSKPRCTITTATDLSYLEGANAVSFHEIISKTKAADITMVNEAGDAAYIIYTSGSTGKPKGAIIEHRNIVNLVKEQDYTIMNEESIILQTGSLAFDASTYEIWGVLLNGGTLCLVEKDILLFPERLQKAIEDYQVTEIFITVALFNQIIEERPEAFHSLKVVMTGGEKVNGTSIKKMRKVNPDVIIENIYGPTETTTFATFHPCSEVEDYQRPPIGKPIAGVKTYVMEGDNLCGIGVPGELYIAGNGVSRGYLNNEELTNEKFVMNPFTKERMYRTGDLVRVLSNGCIDFLGRIDAQVKIRGYRIEMGEIEKAITDQIGVPEAAVIVQELSSGEKMICAYLVDTNRTLDSETVKDELRNSLPEYMIPNVIMQIDKIPLTVNGKVDRKALPEVKLEAVRQYAAPRNEVEQQICDIFQEVLNVERIGIYDNFFELGGHSLRATKVINQIEAKLGVRLTLKTMFVNSTPEHLAKEIVETKKSDYEGIPKADEKEFYPMSSTQRRLFVMEQMGDLGTVYNMPYAVTFKGNIDMEKMKQAFASLINRHELLRTQFSDIDGELVQKVLKDVDVQVEYEERMGCSEEEKQAVFTRFVRVFDLGKAPLMRVKVLKCGDEESILFMDMHHIISDGMSMNIVQKELTALYNGEELPELRVQYKDYSEWLRQSDMDGQKTYWLQQFADEVPVMNLPLDYKRPKVQSFRGAMVEVKIPEAICNKIEELARNNGATAYMCYVAAYMIVLSRYSGQEDIAMGTPISGRTNQDMEHMLGMFVNTLVLRGYPVGTKTFIEFFQEVKEICLKAYENQEYPFDELIESLDIVRDMSRNPLFDVMFAFQNNERVEGSLKGLDATDALALDEITAKFDITVSVEQVHDGYSIILEYCKDLFSEETMQYMANHYARLLEEIVGNPERQLKDYNFCSEKESKLLVEQFNDNTTDYSVDKNLGELFREQVFATPDAIAVVYGDTKLTYKELDQMSDKIGTILLENGVKADDAVAIVAKKSVEIIAGILGILKVGAAYVPIDENYPEERIQFMLNDCKAKLLLTYANEAENKAVNDAAISVVALEQFADTNPVKLELDYKVTSSNLAYIIYTSGTSGKPKGSLIEQKSILRLVKNTNFAEFNHETIVLQTGSISFDASTFEIWGPLLNGGTLILADQDIILDPYKLKQEIIDKQVSMMWLTAALFNQMVDSDVSMFASLKYLLIGGEKLSESHVRYFKKNNYKTKLINGYGPTENTTFTTTYEIPEEFEFIPIGQPIANTKVYIMKDGELCGIGVPGELCTSGAGLSRGYLNLEELTAEKFTDNPFGEGKLYHTGDLARWHENGLIEYMGRIDEQVKIRGFRIELAEVENAILSTNMAKETAVLVKEDEYHNKFLAAYIVTACDVNASMIKEKLAALIPEYMIPAHMMFLDKMPVTTNGKLNKRALPEIALTVEAYEAPSTKEEEVLVDALSETLGFKEISVTSSFFELGGDSIKAIRLVSKIRERGYDVSVKDIIGERVIRNIATKMVKVEIEESYAQEEIIGEAELSPIQKTFFGWNYPYANHFNQALIFRTEDYLEEDVVREVLERVVEHHDALRTVFRDGKQIVLSMQESKKFDLYSFDLTGMDDYQTFAEKKNTEIQASMDIENGPLVKAVLYKIGAERHLLIAIHHLVVDGVSWRILLEDISILMEQTKKGLSFALPSKTMPYMKWVEKLAAQCNQSEVLAQRAYWEKVNQNVLKYEIPVEETGRGIRSKSIMMELGEEDTKKLLYEANAAYQTGIQDLLFAALGMAVKEFCGMSAIAVAQESHGRQNFHESIKVERTVGWFTNLYPIIIEADGTIEDVIIKTKEMVRSIPDEGLGYSILKSYQGDCHYDATPDLCFNYLGDFDTESGQHDSLGGSTLSAGDEFNESNRMSYSMSISGTISNKILHLSLTYDESRRSDKEMERFLAIFVEKVREVSKHCAMQKEVTYTAADFGTPGIPQEIVQKVLDHYKGKDTVEKIYSLTPLQQGMLYYKLLDKESTEYVIQEVFRIQKRVDKDAMEKSLVLLATKYDSLRTSIFYEGVSQPKQVVLKERVPEFIYEDISSLKNEEKEYELVQMREADVARGFDLQEESLLRITVIQIAEEECLLLWSAHHIIMDGWCTSLLFKDFLFGYEMLASKQATFEQALTQATEAAKQITPYSEYIAWLERQDKQAGLEYWKQMLSGYDEVASIKSCANLEQTDGEVNIIEIVFNEKESMNLHRVAIEHNITLNTMIESAWGVVLQRYNRVDDVVFGKVVSGRDANIPGIEDAVGLFINTIPVRVRVDNETTISSLLEAGQEQSVQSQNYDFCALSEIQECSEMEYQLFDTLFVYENYYMGEMDKPKGTGDEDKNAIILENAREETNYPITVSVSYEKELHINIMYNTSQYSEQEITKVLEHLRQVLVAFQKDREQRVQEITFLTDEEKQEVLIDLQGKAETGWEDKTVIEVWENVVETYRDKPAVKFEDQEITFGELNAMANQLAYQIREHGVGPDDFVAIMAERSIELIVAIFGVIKAGGAYVPIDPTYPEDRILYMLGDCKPKVVLTYHTEVPEGCNADNIKLENIKEFTYSKENPVRVNKITDLLYMIYTSGTTGRPKGVMIEHAGLLNMVKHYEHEYEITSADTILQFASISFDQSVWDIFGSLLLGAAICCMPYSYIGSPRLLEQYMDEKEVTIAALTPAYLKELNPNNLPKLTRIESGGAAADAEVLSMWRKEKIVYNTYGPTEATVNAITFRLNDKNYTNIPIGKPVDNLSVYIVDNGRLCGVGMPGEICIAGIGLARGYLNQEDLTNEKFVDNLFGEGRMYRTGDLGRWLEEGYVEYLGRIDEQVKIRGFRIELGEIETVIKNQEFITDAVVDSRKDKSGEQFLAGYFVAEQEVNIRKLKSNLQAVLPDYMVPAFLMQIEAIPLTQNGKVNKRQLPEAVFGGMEEYVAPRTECEKLLVSIFEEVMECERISIYDSFLDIGGNSIKAIGIASKIRDAGYQFAIKELMMNQNIEEMAANMKLAESSIQVAMDYDYKQDCISKDSMQNSKVYKEVAMYSENVKNAEVECEYQPFGYQENFLIREVANICPVKIKITGAITKRELLNALNSVIEEQSVFRTVFCKENESLLEYAYKGAWEIPYLEGNPEEDILYGDQILFQPELYKEGTLLAKLYVVKESEQVHILYAMVQHGIWDEFSGEIFLKMVEDKLVEVTSASVRESTKEKIHFSDYANDRRNQEESEDCEEMKQYVEEVKHFVSLCTRNVAGYLDAELEVSEQVAEEIRKKPVEWLVKLYQKFMEIEVDTIPFVLMSHGRKEEQFAQLGLFLKMLPCIMRGEELTTYDNCNFFAGELEGLEEESYKMNLPLVNYYNQSGEAQLPELPESRIEIMESQEQTGCLIKLGIINYRLFLQIPVSTMELDKYREILEDMLKL